MPEQFSLPLEPIRKLFSVGELNAHIRDLIEAEFSELWVAGEISGARLAPSGHYYFTLKDGNSQIRCSCFRMTARYLRFKPQDGIAVIARGRLDVYEAKGEYQLIVEHLEPQGHGALQFAYEQLKAKLMAEGLFDAARKRPLPTYPRRIGIITSPAGAVIQDILNVLARRFPGLHIRIYPVQVQGEGSPEALCRAIQYFSASGWAEVVIVARGGGSLEDLWSFNEESVAREIANCAVPVISAVGHETDFTIADFVADLRAPTPSVAAELVICTREQIFEQIASLQKVIEQSLRYRLNLLQRRLQQQGIEKATLILNRRVGRFLQRLEDMERCLTESTRRELKKRSSETDLLQQRLARMDLRVRFAEVARRVLVLEHQAVSALALHLARARSSWSPLDGSLNQLSPLRVLERGYAIVRDVNGRIIKSPEAAPAGTELRLRLAQGEIGAKAL